MSKKTNKQNKVTKNIVAKKQKADGTDEYYFTKAPQKTLGGRIIIWTLVALMALGSLGSLIIAFIQLSK